MRVLMISRDKNILFDSEKAHQRILRYAEYIDELLVVIVGYHGIKNKIKNVTIIPMSWFDVFKLITINKTEINFFPDVVTVQEPLIAFNVGKKLKNLLGGKLEVQLHSDYGGEKWKRGIIRKILLIFIKQNLRSANQIRVVSKRAADWAKKIVASKFSIYLAPVPLQINNKEKNIFSNKNVFTILYTGRFEKEKNLFMLIKAVEKAKKISKKELTLNLVGKGSLENKLLSFGKKQLGNSFKIYPWQTDLSAFYKNSDCFALTSDYEGYGLSVLEAGAYGLPIVMTDVGCANEILFNNQEALISAVSDQDAFVSNLLKVISDEELRGRLSEHVFNKLNNLLKDDAYKKITDGWYNMCKLNI